ncbi:Intermembrane lipid transfer protein [Dirofilaria immitis]
MLENLVAWVLNNYVGEYLENLNTDQLSIALLQGQVELENVPLKKSALRKFDVPLKVKSGLLGKLTLSVPLTRLRSEPWVIRMNDLLVLLEPSASVRYDVENVEIYEQSRKEQQLDELEKYHKRQLLNYWGLPSDSASEQNWWGASLVSAIVNNIQLVLTNVHIRYEDDTTLPNRTPFVCGVRIHNVSMQTTDSHWGIEYMRPQDGVNMFKKLQIEALSVYWNCGQQIIEEIKNYMDLQHMMASETDNYNVCILQPFSAHLYMERNMNKFPLKTYPYVPRFKFNLCPEKVVIELTKRQLLEMSSLGKEWARFDRARQHRKWRPLITVGENAKEWWNFAYNRIQNQERQRKTRCTWSFAYNRAKQLNSYCRAYRRRLLSYLETAAISATGQPNKFSERYETSYLRSASDQNRDVESTEQVIAALSPSNLSTASLKKNANSEDSILMKQIERDINYTYHELQLFRETVFRRILAEKEIDSCRKSSSNENALQSDDESFENIDFHVLRHNSDADRTTISNHSPAETAKSFGGGLYNWLSSWVYGSRKEEAQSEKNDVDKSVLDLLSTNEKESSLPTDFKLLEKQVEDEILDVLNESKDDSTVLHRDTLLAEVKLKLERMTIRFIDDFENQKDGISRVLAMDLWELASCIHLSPRRHSTAMSLTVADLSLQRLCTFPADDTSIENTQNDEIKQESESLMFGFAKETTQILFAVGKARKTSPNISDIAKNNDLNNALFRLAYHRRAPKMVVTHTLDIRCSELSVLYNEDAFDDLGTFFSDRCTVKQNENFDPLSMDVITVIDFAIQCPQLKVELRSKRGNLLDRKKKSAASTPFALAVVRHLVVGISNREQFVTTVKVEFDSLEIEDLFESTTDLLLCIRSQASSHKKQMSASCPNLNVNDSRFGSSSSQRRTRGFSLNSYASMMDTSRDEKLKSSQENAAPSECNIGLKNMNFAGASHITFLLIDKKHSSFESMYKKVNCLINVDIPKVEMCVNRRSYTLLLDFFGLLEPKVELHKDYIEIVGCPSAANTNIAAQTLEPYNMKVNISASLVQILMNYPTSKCHLGVIRGEEIFITTQARINDDEVPLEVSLSLGNCSVSDSTPFYSELYSERISLRPLPSNNNVLRRSFYSNNESQKQILSSRAILEITKCLCAKSAAIRGYNINIMLRIPSTMSVAYVHTRRYLSALLDFWQHFIELQDIVLRNNASLTNIRMSNDVRNRIQLNCEIECPCTIVLPLNQLSNQDFKIGNIFDDDDHDCCVDWITVVCTGTSIFEGIRIANSRAVVREVPGYEKVCGNMFQHFHFLSSRKNVFSKPYDLFIDIFRNQDISISHRVPDVVITTSFNNLNVKLTTDFYRLLRGFLSMNLGDPLVLASETIPIEILQKPAELYAIVGASSKYASFSFRMILKNVEFNCFIQCGDSSQGFLSFAGVKLNSSCILFDVYIDNQSELDLISESTELIDARFVDMEFDKRPNVFHSVLFPLSKGDSNRNKLMFEAHVIFKCDEAPVITLVLLNARLLLLLDWLNDMKNFLLLHSDFIPPVKDAFPGIAYTMKSGIIQRDPQICESLEQTFSLKITLKECDLVLLERPDSLYSLALAAHTTAVLNMNDAHELLNVNLEIQRMNVDWFMMASESESRCQLTNDFSMTLSLSIESDAEVEGQLPRLGLSSVIPVKHRLVAEITDMVARVSYRDLHVVRNVLVSSLNRLNKSIEKSVIPKCSPELGKKESALINVIRIILKGNQISFWLMDDFQGTVFPLIRCKFRKFYLNRRLEKINGFFTFVADYFNQNVFGWEPLIEDWDLKQLTVVLKNNTIFMDLFAGEHNTFNINITQTFLRQAMRFNLQLSEMKHSLNEDFRGLCVRSRSDHLPYILHNETGSKLCFTTAVDEVLKAKSMQRKSTAKWYETAPDSSTTFEFPTKQLTMAENSEESHQLIVHIDGWDEISPVNVDAVGTYFRMARSSASRAADSNFGINVRLVIVVTMDKNGRKVVTVRSALTIINHLSDSTLLFLTCENAKIPETSIIRIDPKKTLHVPLKFASASVAVKPDSWNYSKALEVKWQEAKSAGERINKLLKFEKFDTCYWMCLSIKREHYPEYEMLSGHTISFSSPLSILNLLPVDAEFRIVNKKYAVSASKQIQITSVNTAENISFEVATDRFISVREITITKSSLMQQAGDVDRLHLRMKDSKKRYLDMYCSLSIGSSGTVLLALWVPYWIVNKSGIPLIIKQEATSDIAAGQMEEHESAKDRNPLMFSFANDNCPKQCTVRIGANYASDQNYRPLFGPKFPLTVGLHSMKLRLVHDQYPTQIYNIGVEVRQGTGRYKDTQVVMLTPRYVLNNQTSFGLSLSHIDHIDQPNHYVKVASKCNLIWNENFEDNRMICVKRDDVKYWSCPFRIDLISSFHVTMRDADETPQFLRVEVILNSAIFYITFTDVRHYPPPIQLENLSDVPVLYQQKIERSQSSHLRTICKARSTVDYAWDDHYGAKILILQVFENKSNFYDPQKPGMGPPLVYTNDVFIKFVHSFDRKPRDGFTDELELVLEVLHKGKVILNKLNPNDSSRNQLWRFTQDGCLENIGMNNRSKTGERYVLDVLDNGGFVLMMLKRNSARDRFQKWQFTSKKQLRCKVEGMFVEARKTEVVLSIPKKKSILNENGVPLEQMWELQSQLPGSGVLDVECLHRGPTLVVRITDREKPYEAHAIHRPGQLFHLQSSSNACETKFNNVWNFEINVSMRNGIGLSFINGYHEELIYARFQGIVLHMNRQGPTYQITGSVEVIQADNQMLTTDRWQVLFCQQDVSAESDPLEPHVSVPALKLEVSYTPLEYYDAFDCFRLKMCDLSVQLDETLLWKIVQFVQKAEAAECMKPNALLQPPNTELDKLDRVQTRRCYFGTFDLEIGSVVLSVVTIGTSGLPPELRKLKRQFNLKLVSFENAVISLPPFRQFRYFETFSFLIETLSKFYLEELKNQTFSIIVTMDAFGNPLGLASDLKESFEGLLFEGNLGGFVSGLGYCFTNSISKVASSMATGVGALTFDERHEMLRRRMLRCQPQTDSNTALTHLYCGVKGLGVGVLGGLTAILTNTYNESRKSGLTGAMRGITTGAVDTVTKPIQGIFDLVEGTASAVKEIVGGPSTRKSHFPPHRVRLPRVTMNLQSLLPCYSEGLACAQLELLRINGFAANEMLFDVEMLLDQKTIRNRVKQYALAVPVSEKNIFFGIIEVVLEISSGRRQRLPHIWCNRFEVAKRLCEKNLKIRLLLKNQFFIPISLYSMLHGNNFSVEKGINCLIRNRCF